MVDSTHNSEHPRFQNKYLIKRSRSDVQGINASRAALARDGWEKEDKFSSILSPWVETPKNFKVCSILSLDVSWGQSQWDQLPSQKPTHNIRCTGSLPFPLSPPEPLSVCPRIIFQINYLHSCPVSATLVRALPMAIGKAGIVILLAKWVYWDWPNSLSTPSSEYLPHAIADFH